MGGEQRLAACGGGWERRWFWSAAAERSGDAALAGRGAPWAGLMQNRGADEAGRAHPKAVSALRSATALHSPSAVSPSHRDPIFILRGERSSWRLVPKLHFGARMGRSFTSHGCVSAGAQSGVAPKNSHPCEVQLRPLSIPKCNLGTRSACGNVSVIFLFRFGICFGFRASDFEFSTPYAPSSSVQRFRHPRNSPHPAAVRPVLP
jgi:hypothetical protein